MGMGSIEKPMASKVNHIENRVTDLAGAEGDTLKRLADIEAQRRTLEDDLHAIRLERYELTESAAPGPLFNFIPICQKVKKDKR